MRSHQCTWWSLRFQDFSLRFRKKVVKPNGWNISIQTLTNQIGKYKDNVPASNGLFTFRNFGQCAVDAHSGLGGQQDCVVGLTHGATQDALEITGTVTESDEDHGLT